MEEKNATSRILPADQAKGTAQCQIVTYFLSDILNSGKKIMKMQLSVWEVVYSSSNMWYEGCLPKMTW